MPVRAALFDVGGTLLETPPADPFRAPVLAAIHREFGERPWIEALYAADIRQPRPDDPHRQETVRWLRLWLRDHGDDLTDADCERLRLCFAAEVDYTPWLCEGAAEALRWCKARGLAVALVTNTRSTGDAEARRNWDRAGFADVVDQVVTSVSVGWEKPHPAMYRCALERLRTDARSALMVGNDPALDVVPAKALGMRVIWKRPAGIAAGGDVAADASVASLSEVPAILAAWLHDR